MDEGNNQAQQVNVAAVDAVDALSQDVRTEIKSVKKPKSKSSCLPAIVAFLALIVIFGFSLAVAVISKGEAEDIVCGTWEFSAVFEEENEEITELYQSSGGSESFGSVSFENDGNVTIRLGDKGTYYRTWTFGGESTDEEDYNLRIYNLSEGIGSSEVTVTLHLSKTDEIKSLILTFTKYDGTKYHIVCFKN
jgi:hypothetical protein